MERKQDPFSAKQTKVSSIEIWNTARLPRQLKLMKKKPAVQN